MNHIKSFDAFNADNAHLYEGNLNSNDETDAPTLYESIKERAFGELVRKEGSLLEHGVDDSFLQDLGDLAQVNENGEMTHLDKTFDEMVESFNAYYSVELPLPKNPKAVFESLAAWYEENEENITPERFEQKFILATLSEGENLHDDHLRSDKTSTVAEDEAKVDGICAKEPGTMTPEEFNIICKSRIRARGQASTKDRYQKLHARWNEEIEAQKSKSPAPEFKEPSKDAMDQFYATPSTGIAPNAPTGA